MYIKKALLSGFVALLISLGASSAHAALIEVDLGPVGPGSTTDYDVRADLITAGFPSQAGLSNETIDILFADMKHIEQGLSMSFRLQLTYGVPLQSAGVADPDIGISDENGMVFATAPTPSFVISGSGETITYRSGGIGWADNQVFSGIQFGIVVPNGDAGDQSLLAAILTISGDAFTVGAGASSVPAPSSLALLSLAGFGLAAANVRRRRNLGLAQ